MFTKVKENFFVIVTACLAVFLQVQFTFLQDSSYSGLRFNLADITLPFLGLMVLFSLFLKQSIFPRFSSCSVYLIVGGMCIAMTMAMLQSYWVNEGVLRWAFINKYIGFFVLLSYFAFGAWLATNKDILQISKIFLKYFSLFFAILLFSSVFCFMFEPLLPVTPDLGRPSWDGLMANRNSFMIVALFSIIVLEVYRDGGKEFLPPWFYNLFWAIFPFFLVFNASRSFWFLSIIVLLGILIKNPKTIFTKIMPFLCIGGLAVFVLTSSFFSLPNNTQNQFKRIFYLTDSSSKAEYLGDQKRFMALEDGLELYKQSSPVLGAGLGIFQEYQLEKRGQYIDIIDCSLLWILVETGILGLIFFTSFFLMCLWVLYKKGFGEHSSLFHRALFFFLILFGCVSLLHEMTYTRFVWFALGMALAIPKEKKF